MSPLCRSTIIATLFSSAVAPELLSAQRADSTVANRPESATVTGQVHARGVAIAHAQVLVEGTGFGAATDGEGEFRVAGLSSGPATLLVRAIGYAPERRALRLSAGETTRAVVELQPVASVLGTVVTTGTLQQVRVQDAPVKVAVISTAFLQRNVTNNLMDNVSFFPGLNQQVDCGVCFTNNIRINGMEGPYTAVLIDGTPMMSALATVYGLNAIDPSLVEQVELTKGPSSTLYGSEAMGGVINVITKDARFAPRLSLGAYATSDGETSANLAAARTFGGAATLLSVSGSRNDRFVDRNGDDFSDLPLVSRISVFNKWSPAEMSEEPMQISARYYHETRFGGTSEWTSADRGSSTVYGESIRTSRVELLGTYTAEAGGSPIRADAAFNWHDQNSYYGDQPYMATQTTTFVQGAWLPGFGRSSLALGATLRYQSYRDSAAFHQTRDENLTPGLFAQDELALGAGVTLLAGLRVDRHPAHGTIPSPRLALKWDAGRNTTLRVNAATGFRVVSLFTEDHAALTGARDVRIEGKLDPERSRNLVVSLNRTFDIEQVPDALTLDVDAYWTRFTNRIVPDYDTDPELIVYRNLRGMAETRGVEIALGYATALEPLSANLGITLQDVHQVNDGVRSEIAFATRFQGVFTLGYRFPRRRLALDWTGRVLGPMQLPNFEGLPSRSPWFTEQHLQGTWSVRPGVDVYGAVKNVFDYVQANPIIDPRHPFGDDFDTARVYGPIQGRRVLLGMRYALGQ